MSRETKLNEFLKENGDRTNKKVSHSTTFSHILEEDDFYKMRSRMEKNNIWEVVICNGCSDLRVNGLGTYCRNGTRRVRKFNDKIVCLDCDQNRLDRIEVSKEEFEVIENSDKIKIFEESIKIVKNKVVE
jgi:hypothetical protein